MARYPMYSSVICSEAVVVAVRPVQGCRSCVVHTADVSKLGPRLWASAGGILNFSVRPDDIGKFSDVLGRQQEHTEQGKKYSHTNLNLATEDKGLLSILIGAHQEVQETVFKSLDELSSACAQSKGELQEAASLYRNTDAANAERLDRSYPEAHRPPAAPVQQGSQLGETNNPESELKPPGPPEGFQNPLQPIVTITNLLSPGYWVQQALEATIGTNPVQEVSELVAGNWEEYAKCASAFLALGKFVSGVASNISTNNDRLDDVWNGNAADGAYAYFSNLAKSIAAHQDGYNDLHGKYQEAAKGVWEFSLFIAGEIQGLFDKLFWIAVEAAAGAALAETGVGPVLMWSIAAFQCKQVVDEWGRISKEILNIQRLVRTVHGNILTAIGSTGSFQSYPLPNGGYQHPGLK